jgi:hypothetical protein
MPQLSLVESSPWLLQHVFIIRNVVAPACGRFLRFDKRNVSISHPIHACYMIRPSDLFRVIVVIRFE